MKTPWWLLTVGVWQTALFVSIAAARCSDGKEVFMLATNAHLESREVSDRWNNATLTECVERCKSLSKCQSLTFFRNSTSTQCSLMAEDMDTGRLVRETELSPVTGTHYFQKLCLKEACDRLFVVEWLQGWELDGYDDVIISNASLRSCLEACQMQEMFVCRSVELDSETLECRLSRHDRFTRHTHFKQTKSSMQYYDNTCAYKAATGNTMAEILLLGNVAHAYSLVEYRGLSVSECGDLCLRSALFPCRSFLFGRKDGRPFCGLTHQNRAGLLQNPGSFEPSRDLSYYEIARNIEACDTSDVHFELVTGAYLDVSPYKVATDLRPRQCLDQCRSEVTCRSVSIDYRKGACEFSSESMRTGLEGNMKENPHFNYFEKICLPGHTCQRDWAFERVRGKELVGIDHEKRMVEANTREECQSACLQAQDFVCRSAEFNYQLSECRLSPYTRFSSNEKAVSLESSRFVIDYFENNCIAEARGFCNTKVSKKYRLTLADLSTKANTASECEQTCLDTEDFVCRSYSFDTDSKQCLLSHHLKKSAPAGAFVRSPTAKFVEISTCFDVSVECEPEMMKAKVRSNTFFRGRVYAKEKMSTCFLDVTNSMDFVLPIQLTGPECGTLAEEEGQFSNVLVIQTNDQVVTALDKAVGVHCSYEIGNKTEEATLNVTGSLNTDHSRGKPKLPNLSLHILDMAGKERDSVTLGELLKIQVRMSEEETYGIFLRNLIAKDGSGSNNLTLVDHSGCPVEAKMMREIRTVDSASKSLESYLEAFTFTGSSTLELEAEVETCLERCKPVLCQIPTGRSDDDLETVSSFGRRKRRHSETELDVVDTVTITKTITIQASEFGLGVLPVSLKHHLKNFGVPVTAAPTSAGIQSANKAEEEKNMRDEGLICFEPTTLALIGGTWLFVEACVFIACVILACKIKNSDDKDLAASRGCITNEYSPADAISCS